MTLEGIWAPCAMGVLDVLVLSFLFFFSVLFALLRQCILSTDLTSSIPNSLTKATSDDTLTSVRVNSTTTDECEGICWFGLGGKVNYGSFSFLFPRLFVLIRTQSG